MERAGVKLLLRDPIPAPFPRVRPVGLDAASNGNENEKGTDWLERTLGWSAQSVAHPPRYQQVGVRGDIPLDQIDWSK